MVELLDIYVPIPESRTSKLVMPKSAVVARPSASDGVLCYFEGGSVHPDYFSKLRSAAGRLVTDYPTIAVGVLSKGSMIKVGTYDASRFVVEQISNPEVLARWCAESAEEIMGRRPHPGALSWDEATALVSSSRHSMQISRLNMSDTWYKTQAGQIVRFDLQSKTASLHDHDEPGLLEKMLEAGLHDRELTYVLGLDREECPV